MILFRTRDRVKVGVPGSKLVEAIVVVASANGESLGLQLLDQSLRINENNRFAGLYLGFVPVLYDGKVFRDLVNGAELEIERG